MIGILPFVDFYINYFSLVVSKKMSRIYFRGGEGGRITPEMRKKNSVPWAEQIRKGAER